jgi:P4 family phage/plasmid primase-like protien
MNKVTYKFAIIKGRKNLYNGQMKIEEKEISPGDMPVLVPGGKDGLIMYGTPNRKLVERLVNCNVCETPEMIGERLQKIEIKKETGNQFINDDGQFMHTRFAEWLYKESGHYFLLIRENDEMYYYKDGIYIPKGETYIGEIVQDKVDWEASLSTTHVREITGNMKRSCTEGLEIMKGAPNYIACKNGLLNLETKKLIPHSPEHYTFKKIPWNYNPKATCHNIDNLIEKLIPEVDGKIKLDTMLGYTLINSYIYNKIFFIYGPPGTGKTTIINIIQNMLGDGNYSSVRLHDLINEKFMRVQLVNSYANFSGDASNTPIMDGSILKILSGDGKMDIDKKNVPDPITLANTCKLIIDTNEPPRFDTNDDALYRRFIHIYFDQVVHKDDKKPDFMKPLLTEFEMEGLFARAVENAHMILTKKDPFEDMGIEDTKHKHEINSWGVIDDFKRRHVSIITDHAEDDIFEVVSDVWLAFNAYMNYTKIPDRDRIKTNKFYKLFREKCDLNKPINKTRNGVTRKVYENIQLHGVKVRLKGFNK